MTKQEKIESIYEAIADKGGIYLCKGRDMPNSILQIDETHKPHYNGYQPFPVPRVTEDNYRHDEEYIIGHPVMINRLEYILEEDHYREVKELISKEELILPVEKWNEKAIDKLYLISKGQSV